MSPAVVGRDRELALGEAFLDGLPGGVRALLIEGDSGIGKTAVWQAALANAATRGYRVLRCVGEQAEARLSFVGLADLIGDAEDEIASLPDPQRDALERALLKRGGARTADAKAIGVAFRTLLAGFSAAGPVLLAVDDVQWLDGATAAALAFAIRRLEGHPVGLLATVRAPLLSADPLGLERALSPDRLTRFRLGPLGLGALRTLLESRLEHRYQRPTLMRIAQVSGGNPLFALELARALGPVASLEAGAPLPVPDSLRELVGARVAAVPRRGREALLTAAALSHPTTDVVGQAASAAGLAAAEEAGLMRVEGKRIVFAHPLYASAVYAAAASGRRRDVHRRLAEIVGDPEERARHLALATTPPNADVATALEAAAVHARTRGAWDAAGELLEQASAFTAPAETEAGRHRAVRAAENYIHAGARSRARLLLEGVLAEAPARRVRVEALRLLADVHCDEDSFVEAARRLEEALEYADEPTLRVGVNTALAYVHIYHGGLESSDRHAALAVAEAEPLDDALLAEALAMQAMVDFLLGRGVDWERVERAVELEDTTRVVPLSARPSAVDAALTLFVCRLPEAREKLGALRRTVSDSGDESDLATVLFWLSWLETEAGQLAEAASIAEEAAANAVLTGSASTHAWVLGLRALVHAHRGEAEDARADAAGAAAICASAGFWQPLLWVGSALALLELSLGNPTAAWEAVRPLTETAETEPIREPHVHRYLPEALEALIALGELDRAERLLDRFETRAREVGRSSALGVAGRARGLLLAAHGNLEGAEQALHDALLAFERLEMRLELARTLLIQGQVRRRRRQKRAAREPLEQALTLFEGMGARLWAERTRAELDRIGARGTGGLTASERRVCELAAEGHSNKEIARQLFVSVHTVELHLTHAFAKLGIRSRSQLAGRLGAQT